LRQEQAAEEGGGRRAAAEDRRGAQLLPTTRWFVFAEVTSFTERCVWDGYAPSWGCGIPDRRVSAVERCELLLSGPFDVGEPVALPRPHRSLSSAFELPDLVFIGQFAGVQRRRFPLLDRGVSLAFFSTGSSYVVRSRESVLPGNDCLDVSLVHDVTIRCCDHHPTKRRIGCGRDKTMIATCLHGPDWR
jgi:hypothetical protein